MGDVFRPDVEVVRTQIKADGDLPFSHQRDHSVLLPSLCAVRF